MGSVDYCVFDNGEAVAEDVGVVAVGVMDRIWLSE